MSTKSEFMHKRTRRFVSWLAISMSVLLPILLLALSGFENNGAWQQLLQRSGRQRLAMLKLEPDKADRPLRKFIAIPNAQTVSVQNIVSTTAQITAIFRTFTDTVTGVITDTLTPETNAYYVESSDFFGSAEIEHDFPVLAANFYLSEVGNDAYLGSNLEADLPLYQRRDIPAVAFRIEVPYLIRDKQWDTQFSMQNLSTAHAPVAITLYLPDGTVATSRFFVIPARATQTFFVSELIPQLDFYEGGVIISSSQALNFANSIRIFNQTRGLRASYTPGGFLGLSRAWVVPALFKKYDLQSSQLCLINPNSAEVTIDVSYTDGITATLMAVKPGAPTCLFQDSEAHADGWVGGAVVSATQPIPLVVVVNAHTNPSDVVGIWAYTPATRQQINDRTLAFPFLIDGPKQWSSMIYLFNPSQSEATITPRYVDQSGFIPCAQSFTLAAGATSSIALSQAIPFFEEGMGYFTSTVPIAAVLGATSDKPITDSSDRHFGYEAAYPIDAPTTPIRPCSSTALVFLPLLMR